MRIYVLIKSSSTISVTKELPPKPDVFHGRDEFVSAAVDLLINAGTARLAVLGAGGMGKTSVALAIAHVDPVADYFGNGRLFLSCEALSDADSLVIALAKVLALESSKYLLSTVISHLKARSRTLLILDNFETVRLAEDVTKAPAIELLLATLAKIPSLSLIITCRGNVLPPRVRWSNSGYAALTPFSLAAVMQTFEDTADHELSGEDKRIAEELLREVDMMPLAVSLLGQLAQRGVTVSELLDRWNSNRNAVLSTRSSGRHYSIDASLRLTIDSMSTATSSPEPLQLLAMCSMLPDGLCPSVFDSLRGHFDEIDSARQVLRDYALVSVGVDSELKTLSPIRHFTLLHHPPTAKHHVAICSLYFALACYLGRQEVDKGFKERAAIGTLEMGNLASLLLTLVYQPSLEIVQAVVDFTHFVYWIHPTVTVASALVLHLEQHPGWKAICLLAIGQSQMALGAHQTAVQSFAVAMGTFLELGERSLAAMCMRDSSSAHLLLGDVAQAECLLGDANCTFRLAELVEQKGDISAAVDYLKSARQAFSSLGDTYNTAKCSERLGSLYSKLGDFESAAVELEAARSVFTTLAVQFHLAQITLFLGLLRHRQGLLSQADQLLGDVETYYKNGDRSNFVNYIRVVAELRVDQGRPEDAITWYETALPLFEELGWKRDVEGCRDQLQCLKATL